MNDKNTCTVKKNLGFPLDRQGTLYVDSKMHSTGIFDKKSGLYVSSMEYDMDIPEGNEIVLLADDGERIEIESIIECPEGEAHHHFTVE